MADIICPPRSCDAGCLQGPSCLCTGDCPPSGGGGCTGPASCASNQCCIGGSCEPKSGSSCGGGGTFTCGPGTHDNGRCVAGQRLDPPCCDPDPACTCPSNCGYLGGSVSGAGCITTTCGATASCATAPPGCVPNTTLTCSSACGLPARSYFDGCQNIPCAATTPCGGVGTPPPVYIPEITGVIWATKTNDCVNGSINVDPTNPIKGYTGASINFVRTTGTSRQTPAPYALIFNPFSTGFSVYGEDNVTTGDKYTVSLDGLPAGYRCSDGQGCPTSCLIRNNVIVSTKNIHFYINNLPPSATPTPTPGPATDWWQVTDGDITVSSDLVSKVPAGSYFNTAGLGGFPGIPVYGGSINTGSGTVSAKSWNANTSTSFTRLYNYSYFENLIPDDVVLNDVSKLATGVGAVTYSDGYQ